MAAQKQKTVLFLGAGNTRRSRFAEAQFNFIAAKMGLGWRASSRGLAVVGRALMDAAVAKALKTSGILASVPGTQTALQVTVADMEQADRIVAMSANELQMPLQKDFAEFMGRIEFWQIDDTTQALAPIEQEVMALVARLLGGGQAPPAEPRIASTVAASARASRSEKPLIAKVGRETAGRRGKGVTTVFDLRLSEEKLRELAAELKARCGTGGTVKDGRIEIQGDQRDRIVAELEKMGYQTKRAGG